MKKITVDIGLDIGIASVGWAITNVETLEIMKHGVRLFPTVDSPKDSKLKNEERREARSARRQINRRRTLKRDFIKFLIDKKFITDIKFDKNGAFVKDFLSKYINNPTLQNQWKKEAKDLPYIFHLRRKALRAKVSKNELIAILYWYINHRGFKYEVVEEKKKKNDDDKFEKIASKFPLENQIQYFKNKGYINGTLNRLFHQSEYLKEIEQIFTYNEINKKLQTGFIKYFTRQRSFEEGPGNEQSRTKYGRFYNLEATYDKSNKLSYQLKKVAKVPKSIWESTIGKCSFYPEQVRAPKKSFTSEVFNLLNELGNIEVKTTGEVLEKKQKLEIIKTALDEKATSNSILKKVCQLLGIDPKDKDLIKGIPKNKSDQYFITQIESVKQLRKVLPPKFYSFDYLFNDLKINSDNIIDQIIVIFSKTKVVAKRLELLEKLPHDIKENKELIDKLSKLNLTGVSQTHALSLKAMRTMIPDFILEPKLNQMIWAQKNNINFNENKDYGTTFLKADWINDVIATPSVKRSFRQSTKVLNAIFKLTENQNWAIRSIVIEMAREAKNKDAKEQEKNRQKYLENKNKHLVGIIETKFNKDFNNLSNRILEKIWLLDQQKGHDAYTGEKIKMADVINHPGHFDVDHIIPYSQSYSNNRSNKVLTKQQINHDKGKLTAFQYLQKKNPQQYEKMKKMWNDWYRQKNVVDRKVYLDFTKYDFLTSEIDYSIPQNQLGFIGRNLVDTRYTTKTIMEALNGFSKNEQNNFNFKVKAINGKMTSFARNKIAVKYKNGIEIERLKRPNNLPLFDQKEITINKKKRVQQTKSRIWNGHHAEDAYIVTILNSHFNDSKAIEKILSNHRKFSRFKDYQKEQQENWITHKFSDLMAKFDLAREKLNSSMNDMKFSRMVEKPKNTKLFNETLYKGKKNSAGFINQYENRKIMDKGFKAYYYFGDEAKQKKQLMIYRYNRNLYNELNKIYNNYFELNKDAKKESNPFFQASQDGNKRYLEVTYQTNSKKTITKKIRKLNLITSTRDPLRIVSANENGASFYEGLNWVAIHMYKNKRNKYKLIPINALNCNFETLENGQVNFNIKQNVIKKQLEKNDIENSKPIATFFRGDILIDKNNDLLYICGLDVGSDKIEVKFLEKNKIKGDKKQDYRTINTSLKGTHLVKLDILGTKHKSKFTF